MMKKMTRRAVALSGCALALGVAFAPLAGAAQAAQENPEAPAASEAAQEATAPSGSSAGEQGCSLFGPLSPIRVNPQLQAEAAGH